VSLQHLTENPVSEVQPSEHPYNLLTLRQFFILMARAYGREMVQVARALRISRDTLYQEIHRAERTLRRGARVRPACQRCHGEPRLPGRRIGQRCAEA